MLGKESLEFRELNTLLVEAYYSKPKVILPFTKETLFMK